MLGNWSIARSFNIDIRRLLAAWGCVAFGYFGIQAVLLNIYLLRLGFGIDFIGLLIASGQLTWALFALPAGAIGRQFGLRRSLAMGYGLVAVGMALLLLVEALPPTVWTPWIYGSWLIYWIGAAFNTVNSTPYMMGAASEAERPYAFSAQSAVIAVMAFAGGAIAGLLPGLFAVLLGEPLDGPAPYRVALWVAPLVFLLPIFLMAGASPMKLPKGAKSASRTAAPIGLVVLLGVIVFLQTAGEGAARAFFNVYMDTDLAVNIVTIGTVMGLAQLLPVLVAVITPQIMLRFGTERTLAGAGAALAVALMVLALVPNWIVAGLGFSAVVSIASLGGIARNIFSQELVPLQWRTISSAILTIGLALGWAIMAALGGPLVEAVGFRGFFLVSAVLALLSVVVILGYRRFRPREPLIASSE